MKIAIVGTVGVPARYGGFETLADNLVKYHHYHNTSCDLIVYCSGRNYSCIKKNYLSSRLIHIRLGANGFQSIFYDTISIIDAIIRKTDIIYLMGVSGAFILPIIRVISSVKVVTHIDGMEWKRAKWGGVERYILRMFTTIAIKFSHRIISDNKAITDYLREFYEIDPVTIPYGGDQLLHVEPDPIEHLCLPPNYALSICRIEPENNIEMILEALSDIDDIPYLIIGNWCSSNYGKNLRSTYSTKSHIYMLDPIYDPGILKSIWSKASLYIHGHSAGGTNPSLVEAMTFSLPVYAYDCPYNRVTTENKAIYFSTSYNLSNLLRLYHPDCGYHQGKIMNEIASRKYVWRKIAKEYFSLAYSLINGTILNDRTD